MYELKEGEYFEPMEPLREEWAQKAIDKCKELIKDNDKAIIELYNRSHHPSLIRNNYDDIKAIEARRQLIDDPFRKCLLKQLSNIMMFDRPRFKVVKRQST